MQTEPAASKHQTSTYKADIICAAILRKKKAKADRKHAHEKDPTLFNVFILSDRLSILMGS